MTPTTIKQRTIAVPLSDETTATVRRLAWKAHKDLIKAFPREIKRLDLFGLLQLTVAELVDKLPEIITTSEELINHLLVHATDLTVEQIDTQLNALDVGQLVQAALDLNFDAELKNSWAGIGEVVTNLFGHASPVAAAAVAGAGLIPTPPGSTSTPASSMPATAPTT